MVSGSLSGMGDLKHMKQWKSACRKVMDNVRVHSKSFRVTDTMGKPLR